MISDFGSFVEFFAAIYVTMAVNNEFCSNFWTPQYYKEMEQLLKTYDFSGSSSMQNKLMENVKTKYETVQNHAHYRGLVLLTFCVGCLIFMGYEGEGNKSDVSHYVPLLYCTILVGLTLLLSVYLLSNWKRTVLIILFYAFVYFVLKIGNWDAITNLSLTGFLYTYKTQLLIAIILMPIIYQIYIYWLHSRVYKGYLKRHVAIEHNRYKISMEGIKAKDKSKVDEIYLSAWIDKVFSSNEDPALTNFYDVLNTQLLLAASPSYKDLLISWLKHHIDKICKKARKVETANDCQKDNEELNLLQQVQSVVNETSKSELDFTEEYKAYCIWKKKEGKNATVKAFCTKNGISSKDMIAWLRVHNPQKQRKCNEQI